MHIEKQINSSFVLFCIALILALLLPDLCQEGLFMDGAIYSSIARNLSLGIGNFWNLQFSETEFKNFYDHPPLAFGLQSIFFFCLGDAFYVEKVYSFCVGIVTALFIIGIWKKTFANNSLEKLYWLPVVLWISIPKVFWSLNNNMLENTMTLFTMASIYVLLLSRTQSGIKKIIYFIVASVLVFFSFLSKGFPGLFPLGFFFIFYLSDSKQLSFVQMIRSTFLFLFVFILLTTLFFVFNSNAFESIKQYLQIQVLSSISGNNRVGSRVNWLLDFLQEMIPTLVLFFIIIMPKRKYFVEVLKNNFQIRSNAILYALIALSACMPLLISPKLSAYYLVPAFPLFAISFAILIASNVQFYLNQINVHSIGFKLFRLFNYLIIVCTCIYSFSHFGNKFRDADLLNDIEKIHASIPNEKIISISESMYQDWRLIAYFERKAQISINRADQRSPYLLIEKNEALTDSDFIDSGLLLEKFRLMKKITD